MEENINQSKNLWRKLQEIQKTITTFAVSEESEKKTRNGVSEYRYTPGWVITERLQAEMNKRNLMLVSDSEITASETVTHKVYKLIGDMPTPFDIQETKVSLMVHFQWIDTETGETSKVYNQPAEAINGIDKSFPTAMSLAERYFLLKFFHISTREKSDELDAHDDSFLPGIPPASQPRTTRPQFFPNAPAAPAAAVPAGGQLPMQMPQQPAYNRYPQQGPAAPQPARQNFAPAPAPAPAVNAATAPAAQQQGHVLEPEIENAVMIMMQFNKGTQTHSKKLNEVMGGLAQAGFNVDEKLVAYIVDLAQARREGRA